ncbi:MAG: GGDEF domain-containing protein [Oscillibacter sp.]|nr:GGDEF domain-containing protein [Oscillibacter sp.]
MTETNTQTMENTENTETTGIAETKETAGTAETTEKKIKRGVSTGKIVIPAVIIVMLSCISVLYLTATENDVNNKILKAMDDYALTTQLLQLMQHGSDQLTSQVRQYVITGKMKYLQGYFTEANKTQNREKALALFDRIEASASASTHLHHAMEYSQALMKTEYHAMRLCAEANGDNISAYPAVAAYELTEEELAMSTEEKLDLACDLLVNEQYHYSKDRIYENLNNGMQDAQKSIKQTLKQLTKTRQTISNIQRAAMILLALTVALLVTIIYVTLVHPIVSGAREVRQNRLMPEGKGVREVRDLTRAYNEMHQHNELLHVQLRNLAQIDALTGLPNRLAMTYYYSDLASDRKVKSLAVLSLDLNGLKETNDTKGHIAGDDLLRTSADCILDSFGDESGKNCFRFGGDEFAVFLTDVSEGIVKRKVERFLVAQKRYGVSIAVGYAYTEDLMHITAQELFEQADINMYAHKSACKAAETTQET